MTKKKATAKIENEPDDMRPEYDFKNMPGGVRGKYYKAYWAGKADEAMNWQELSAESHYQTAVEIERALLAGKYTEAEAGIRELIEALGRSEKRVLKSQLVRLMAHVIKWQSQPDKRSYSWAATIYNSREEIADIQSEAPSLTNNIIREMWDKCFQLAIREAEGDMSQRSSVASLSWEQVFEDDYEVEGDIGML